MLEDRVRVGNRSAGALDSRPELEKYISENKLRRETLTKLSGIVVESSAKLSHNSATAKNNKPINTACHAKMKTLARLEEHLVPQ